MTTVSAPPAEGLLSKWCGRLLLTAAMVSGWINMGPALQPVPLELDECGTYWIVGDRNPGTLFERSLNYENIPPLSPALRKQFARIAGDDEVAFRSFSVACFLLTIPVCYLIGRDVMNRFTGGLLALFIAWHPVLLGEIRIARCYALTVLLSACLQLSVIHWLRRPEDRRVPFFWAAAALGLIWTHYLNVPAVALSILMVAWQIQVRSGADRMWIFAAPTIVAAGTIPLFRSLLRMLLWGESFGYQDHARVQDVLTPLWWAAFPAFWLVSRLIPAKQTRAVDPVRIPVCNRGVLRMLAVGSFLPLLLIAIAGPLFAPSLTSLRYRLAIEFPAACFLVFLLSSGRRPAIALLQLCLVLAVSWGLANRLPWSPVRLMSPQARQWKELATYIHRNGVPGEPIFVQSGLGESYLIPDLYHDRMLLDFAACRINRLYLPGEHARYGLPFDWGGNPELTSYYAGLLQHHRDRGHRKVWVASATDTDLNEISLNGFLSLLSHHRYRKSEEIIQPDAVLLCFEAPE